MNKPYIFYFDTPYGLVEFPITPGELTITNGSNNKVVTLIDEGDVNILKSPALIEVEFEARFPTRKYPYSTNPDSISNYHAIFAKLKEEKKPFKFIVARTNYAERSTGNTNLTVALEELETNENADEGDDVIYSFKLKQYKDYGVKTLPKATNPDTTSTANNNRNNTNNPSSNSTTYTVKSGDCLWNIAKAAYGDGSKWTAIYEANKSVIEDAAKQHGKRSSSNGHWIYPGTQLVIPNSSEANLSVQKLSNSSNKTTCKLTVKSTGNDDYVGSFTVYCDGKVIRENRKASTSSPFTESCKRNSIIRISCNGNKGHSYSISKNNFKLTSDTTVTIKWVR